MYAEPLARLKSVSSAQKQNIFLQKLELCSFVFDFSEAGLDMREKEMKRDALQDIVDYINIGGGTFTEEVSPAVVVMISKNLFR